MTFSESDLKAVERRIVDRIPLTQYLHLSVSTFDERGLTVRAPLAPNVNHRGTGFGGSLATIATLTGWSLIQLLMQDAGLHAKTVVHHSTVYYKKPITEDFEAVAALPPQEKIDAFVESLRHRGKARMTVHVTVGHGDIVGVEFKGAFVAFKQDQPD